MAEVITNEPIMLDETGKEIVAALKDLSRGGDSVSIDALYQGMLTGENTTKVFSTWWGLSDNGKDTKYQRLERWFTMLSKLWAGKKYTLRYYKDSVSNDSAMTPLDDLADKTAAQLCTESTTPVADWADEDPMTWYIRANALSLADGTMNVLAIEGESEFDISGETAPVWTFCLALWKREWDSGDYSYKSWATTNPGGYIPYAGDVAPDNTKRIMTWRPTFPGGLTSDGLRLTSGSGKKPYLWTSATTGLARARAMDAYEGLWNDADAIWVLDMWQLRHFNLENSNICEGCQSYNFQYKCAVAESYVTRVILTTAQASNLQVGSNVEIGEKNENTNNDRNQTDSYNIARYAKIISIDEETINETTYAAVNVEVDSPFTTTENTLVSTMPWDSGNTEGLPGHKDGACYSLTAGRNPLRVQGVEMMSGAYDIGLDPLYQVTASDESNKWNYAIYECRDSENLSGSITGNYELTGLAYSKMQQGWNYVKKFFRTAKAILFPETVGGSTSGWFKSGFGGANSAGVRCPWRCGRLSNGASAGLAYEAGDVTPSGSSWYGRPRLSGSGKKRGVWAA